MLTRFFQVIQAHQPFQAIIKGIAQQLKFLGGLFLLIIVGGANNHVDRQLRMAGVPGPETVFHPAVRGDGLESEVIIDIPLNGTADAPDIQFGIRAHGYAETFIRL